MAKLSNFIQENELVDPPLKGARYTWTNNQPNLILCRLHRRLDGKWFLLVLQRALPQQTSDHCPIMIKMKEDDDEPRPFKFDLALCEEPGFEGKIKQLWQESVLTGWKGFILKQKLILLKQKIREWYTIMKNGRESRKTLVIQEIEWLDMLEELHHLNEEGKKEQMSPKLEYEEILRVEKITWQQKYRVIWLTEGDRFTRFFHRIASARRQINSINSLREGDELIEDT
ncbi:uncharacterized protein LOC143885971 [Tasmannia lanceolata]|uniref:uncharacterized protein LOC143885971 n=1 Tax=Tasmannia lanceolata TaxID=3420 RepID=UPI0040634C8C